MSPLANSNTPESMFITSCPVPVSEIVDEAVERDARAGPHDELAAVAEDELGGSLGAGLDHLLREDIVPDRDLARLAAQGTGDEAHDRRGFAHDRCVIARGGRYRCRRREGEGQEGEVEKCIGSARCFSHPGNHTATLAK